MPRSSDATSDEEQFSLYAEEIEDVNTPEADVEPISYAGTDFDAEGLVRRLNRGDIVVPNFGHEDKSLELAPFQRGFVWRKSQMDRFIESLLLGFPIPGIMMVEQADKKYLVLDGQQRLRTLQAFYGGSHHDGEEFALNNVAAEYQGLTYSTLDISQKRTLDNTFIQATIVKSDGSPGSLDSVYQVFERLNSGGTQLTPHEIRIALYPGEFVRFLAELNNDENWRELFGAQSLRLRDQELILRILALYTRSGEYSPPLKQFLNNFLGAHRQLAGLDRERLSDVFKQAAAALVQAGARDQLRRAGQRINAALLEVAMIGCMQRATRGDKLGQAKIKRALNDIITDAELERATTSSTTTPESVRIRMQKADKAFRGR